MKRKGILAFVVYLLCSLAGGGLALMWFIEAKQLEASPESGWATLGAVLLVVLGIGIAIPYLLCLLAKIIHLASGIKLFGVICLILDIAILAVLGYAFFIEDAANELAVKLLLMVPSTIALFSNAVSLTE